jgi:hypothetical protein
MPGNLATEEDYTTTTEAPVPWWRRDAQLLPSHGRLSAKHRSRHLIKLPTAVISVEFPAGVDEPDWLLPALKSIVELGSLPDNWNSYGARPVTVHAIVGVLNLLSLIMTEATPLPAFVPTRRGGIQVEWHAGGIDVEIEVSPTGRYRASVDDPSYGLEWTGDVPADFRPLREALARLAAIH